MSHSVDSSPKIASKFRYHVSSKSLKETYPILKGKLSKRHLSKSASELQYRGDTKGFYRQISTTSTGTTTECGGNPSNSAFLAASQRQQKQQKHQDALARHATVVQKTQAFFTTLKERWSRNRGGGDDKQTKSQRHHEAIVTCKSRDQSGALESDDQSQNSGKRIHCERGYSADTSSEQSSSATPSSQSPFHRALHKTTASLSHRFGVFQNVETNQSGQSTTEDTSNKQTFQDCHTEHIADENTEETIKNIIADDSHYYVHSLEAQVEEYEKEDDNDDESKTSNSRESMLREYSFFDLFVNLKCGKNLTAKDKNGTSDPYVKFKIAGKLVYKSKIIYRDLNPVWDENFVLVIEDVFAPVHVKVFDYDWGLQDDFIGSSYIDLTQLDFGKSREFELQLQDTKGTENLGVVFLAATLWPRTQQDKKQYYQKNVKIQDANKRLKSQIWSSVVTIVLIKGTNLIAMDSDGYSDPYVKFRLGNEKYKSKVAYKTLNPKWLEQFDLHLYDDQSQELEIIVWDKDWTMDDFMGRCSVTLDSLEREKTHKITKELEDGCGTISLLLTISGTTASETISDLTTYEEDPTEMKILQSRYSIVRTFSNLKDVGHLTVRVYKAQGLASADICGKSDPFCVVELVNARLQTQTEYKTLTPSWQKIFTFHVKDINSILEVTVYDEDKDHKVEFLGKVAIPLLRIQNYEKRWYALKDKKLRGRAKGNSPQILMEMYVVWNKIRACIRTLNPKEEKFMQGETKFKRQTFVRNVMRLKNVVVYFIEFSKFIQNCFEWESYVQSVIAFIVFILLCYFAEPYMIPIALLLIFFICNVMQKMTGSSCGWSSIDDDEELAADDEDDEDDKDKEEKKSLKERLQAIQDVTQTVQNTIGYIASLCESVKNTFNFSVPFLSNFAISLLLIIAIVLYWIPIRYLIMIWGINKFARKLLRPDTIPNNELLDFLSRVPDDEDLISFRELKTHSISDGGRRLKKPKTF